MKKRLSVLWLIFILLLTACSPSGTTATYSKYEYEFLGVFDTVIQVIGYAKSSEDFETLAKAAETRFFELHKLYDIYENYEGIHNIKTINDNAGIKPVAVRQEIIDLILFSKDWYQKTGGVTNIAMGPVLNLWHLYREAGLNNPEQAEIPPMKDLQVAKQYTDIEKVIVDKEKKTVYLSDAKMHLDVGAVAKGFATEIVTVELAAKGYTSFIISSGGNVKVVGQPLDGMRKKWGITIQDPRGSVFDPNDVVDTVYINSGSVVTSGDYQRYYTVSGKKYHHLIDPATLMPAWHYLSVSIVTEDSGLADLMSTSLFLLPYEESRKLCESIEGVEALWIMPDGTLQATEGMKAHLKILGGATN